LLVRAKAYDDDEPEQPVLSENGGMSVEDRVRDYVTSQDPAYDIVDVQPLHTENFHMLTAYHETPAVSTMTVPVLVTASTHAPVSSQTQNNTPVMLICQPSKPYGFAISQYTKCRC